MRDTHSTASSKILKTLLAFTWLAVMALNFKKELILRRDVARACTLIRRDAFSMSFKDVA
jgi:hypothetical protein